MAKIRHSGMPPQAQWESYFDFPGILAALGCATSGDIVEFGCGYGSFTIPAAQRTSGTVYAVDIDPAMVKATADRAANASVGNVVTELRDFVADGCGRPDASATFVMLFNILHLAAPVRLLREARRVLRVGGVAGVIHWNYDAGTPRGPPLRIRARPQQCRTWGEQAGLRWRESRVLPGTPWHWGMLLERHADSEAKFAG